MKKYTLLTIFFFSIINMFAQQQWGAIGTSWFYNLHLDYEYGYIEIISKKDTIVENKLCKYLVATKSVYKVPGNYITQKIDSFITYQDNYKIYIYQMRKFIMIYDFNPSIGDIWDISETWNTYNTMNTGYDYLDTLNCIKGRVKVDSIKNITLNNKQLKSIYTSQYNNSSMEYSGVIIEGIGCLGYMMPISKCNQHIDSWYPYPIRCYNSYDFNYSWSDKPCDYITAIKEIKSNNISVFPINSEGYLNIKIEKEIISYPINIKIYSYNGIKLYDENILNKYYKISTKDFLSNGIYFIVIKDGYSLLFNSKFIIKRNIYICFIYPPSIRICR